MDNTIEQIPTIKGFLAKHSENYAKGLAVGREKNSTIKGDEAYGAIKEAIDYYVTAALKAAIDKGGVTHNGWDWVPDEKSILNAYPLTNIK